MTASLVVPLGRRLALLDLSPTAATDPRAARGLVQLDGQTVELSGPAVHLWEAAHRSGTGAEDLARQWGLGDADLEAGWAELRAAGAVSDLQDTAAGRRTWARAHTLHPLVPGLGEVAGRPGQHQVGLPGWPAVQLSRVVRDVWAWGPLFGDLWTSVGWHARGYAADGLGGARAVDPDLVLEDVVTALPALLRATAVHVDPALPSVGAP